MDFKELPFPFALTEKELLKSIKDFSASDYVKKVRDFKKNITFMRRDMRVKI